MNKLLAVTALMSVLALASPALSAATPTNGGGVGQPSENASPLGVERATRNSDGGDRAQGGFGPAQSAYVHSVNESGGNYGQTVLQDGGWTGSAK